MPGPDQHASMEPGDLKFLIKTIRETEQVLGDGVKHVSASEGKNKAVARKSIVAKRPIKAGEEFTTENLTVKRPGNGVSPMRWYEVLGQKAKRDFEYDELIEL